MSITVVTPPAGAPFGVGYEVSVTTDVIGPFPIDNNWWVTIRPTGDDSVILVSQQVNTQANSLSFRFLVSSSIPFPIPLPDRRLQPGADMRLVIERRHGLVVQESISQAILYEPQQGANFVLQGMGTTSGGFSDEDRSILRKVDTTLVPYVFWDLIGELVPELVEELINRFRTNPDRRRITPDAINSGEFGPPTFGPFFRWVGIEWAVIAAPDGFGLDEGNPVITEINWGQLSRTRRFVDGSLSVDETFYERRVSAVWYWGFDDPATIRYFIMPGVQVRFWWLIQLEPVAAITNAH